MIETKANASSSEEPVEPYDSPGRSYRKFPWVAFFVGLAFIPVCVWWIEMTEVVVQAADLAAMSLVISVVAFLLLLICVNRLVKRVFGAKAGFSQAELMLIYAMNATTVGLCGIGVMQFLVVQLPAPVYYSTADNHWSQWMYNLRPWAFPGKSAVNDFYNGRSSLFTGGHLAAWMSPIIVWSLFIFVLVGTMYCLATLLRRQWVSRERLLFPLIAIPLEITQNGGDAPIFKNRLFWIGVGIAVFLETLAALHYSVSPGVPYIPIKPREQAFDIGAKLTTPPWNGIGTFQLAIYPMVIGMSYLLSLDVSFSVWFFYLFGKLEDISAVAFGFKEPGAPPAISRIPYLDQQAAGAFTALAIIALYYAMPHLKQAYAYAFTDLKSARAGGYSDEQEPMSYKSAFWGAGLGIIFLLVFGVGLGISLPVTVLFIGLYLLWAITMTRIRAEAGLPWGNGPSQYLHGTIVDTAGASSFSTEQLTGITTLRWMDADYRCQEMQQYMEAMKIADGGASGEQLIYPRHLTKAIAAGTVVAVLSSWWALLSIYYQYGAASAFVEPWRTSMGQAPFSGLQTWITSPQPVDTGALQWIGVGFVATILLSVMRTSFAWWPLNPIGYAVSLIGLYIDWIWFAVFLGWLFKRLIIKYGGLKAYRAALPFFIGLVIGDYIVGAVLALLQSILQAYGIPVHGYRTFPV